MIFNIDEDTGGRIVGWVVPDNPSQTPSIYAVVGGRTRHRIGANDFRNGLKASGLHETGTCGFLIDEQNCPGIAPGVELEFFDAESNMLVFRRTRRDPVPIRLFHLETQTSPIYRLERELSPLVQMSYSSAELVGEDTLVSIFNLSFTESVFVSGALNYRRYEPYMRTKDYRRSVLLGDPHRELAARLLRLQALGRAGGASGGWKSLGQASLIEALGDTDLQDSAALGKTLRAMKEEDFLRLGNPTTRKLVANSADEPVEEHQVGVALGTLADFDVIGFEDDLETFIWNVEAVVGGATLSRDRAEAPPDLDAVTDSVMACKAARPLVRLDALLLDLARQAVERAGTAGAAGVLL
jgi:hypothetical protein